MIAPPPTSPSYKRCLKCGYILDGLPERRCPECGRAFDPNDRGTYNDDDSLFKTNPIWSALIAAAASCGGILGLAFLTGGGGHFDWFGVFLAFVVGGWLIAVHSASLSVRYLKCPYCPRRRAAIAALIINSIALSSLVVALVLLILGPL